MAIGFAIGCLSCARDGSTIGGQTAHAAPGISQAAGYLGSWDFGVGVTGIKGAKSYSRFECKEFAGPSYTADKYTLTTRASLADIEIGTGPVIERLVGRLIRAIWADQIEANKKHFA